MYVAPDLDPVIVSPLRNVPVSIPTCNILVSRSQFLTLAVAFDLLPTTSSLNQYLPEPIPTEE